MGLIDKMKNLFTEEVDEPIKEEVKKVEPRHVEAPPVRTTPPSRVENTPVVQPKPVEPVKEEVAPKEDKFVFFTDDDFKDLEKPKKVEQPKKVPSRTDKPKAYMGTLNPKPEEKKEFKPSPIISPVYGVLNKNYEKSDLKPIRSRQTVYNSAVTIDDVRNKAYGTVEDEIKDDILGKTFIEQTKEEVIEPDIDIFEELDKYKLNDEKTPEKEEIEEIGEEDIISRSTSNVDEIFGKLDTKKEEIIEELDEKKDKILDEIDTKKNMVELAPDEEPKASKGDVELAKELLDDDETLELAQELEEQKKKLEKINNMMDENKKITENKDEKEKEEVKPNDDLEESELFELLDSTYEKKDDE